MCGYLRRHISNKDLAEFVQSIDMMHLYKDHPEDPTTQHFYPAFGAAASKQIKGLIIQEDDEVKSVDATWWFECKAIEDQLIVDNSLTTFNARNLSSAYWKHAIHHNRAIVLATALGEGKEIAGKKLNYFIEGETPLLLGAVYRKFSNNLYSVAIITRNAHPRFDAYHDKAFPLFLPADSNFLKSWLNPSQEIPSNIAQLLENPKVFNHLKITPVKTFKNAEVKGLTEYMAPD